MIARKICGGARSTEGSETAVIISSLFATSQLLGEDSLSSYLTMMFNPPKGPVTSLPELHSKRAHS